jgi:hypothetical protein
MNEIGIKTADKNIAAYLKQKTAKHTAYGRFRCLLANAFTLKKENSDQ